MSHAAAPDLAEAERFLQHEARLLDEARFEDWLALFTADAWYWVPSQPDQTSPRDTVSLIYDDRRLLETRVRRLRNPHLHAQQPPARASRIVANVTIDEAQAGAAVVRSKLLMVEYRRNRQRLFAGTCRHRLVRAADGLRIAWKRVDLVDCDAELEGLLLPF
ncbi:MAG TPA: aromatic-ring-hydroxylating dioxygenase subunit beta [Stellaceae bacterium]|nr:aromatic-ring-hydroxylating dioxygenase subunit beta [Stellaceae bacterium]